MRELDGRSALTDRVHAQVLELTRERRFEEALTICYRCVEEWEDPLRHEAWHNLAYALFCCDRMGEAIDAITKAIELAPEDRAHLFSRARWALAVGDLVTAEADWSKLIEVDERLKSEAFLSAALIGRALTRMRARRVVDAEADLRRVDDEEIIFIEDRLWTVEDIRALGPD